MNHKYNYKYPDAQVYALYSLHSDMLYVGSTVDTLQKRLNAHLISMFTTVQGIIRLGDYHMCTLEVYPCNDFKELQKREEYHILTLIEDGANVTNWTYPTNFRKWLPRVNPIIREDLLLTDVPEIDNFSVFHTKIAPSPPSIVKMEPTQIASPVYMGYNCTNARFFRVDAIIFKPSDPTDKFYKRRMSQLIAVDTSDEILDSITLESLGVKLQERKQHVDTPINVTLTSKTKA